MPMAGRVVNTSSIMQIAVVAAPQCIPIPDGLSKNEKRLYRDTLIISGAKISVGVCSSSQHNAHVYSSKNTSSEQKKL